MAHSKPDYPSARRDQTVDELHGHRVSDPYRWLEDPGSLETQEWLRAQGDVLEQARDNWDTAGYWRARLEDFLGAGIISPPVWRGAREFFVRRQPGQDHGVLFVRDPDGTERSLVDPNLLGPDGLTTLDAWQPSKEGNLVAYQLSLGGDEESALFVIRTDDGEVVEGPIDRTRYSPVAWLPGESAFYYVRRLPPEQLPTDESQYHRRVWLHQVGDDPNNDIQVFGDGRKKTEYYGVTVSRDGRWLTVSASEGTAPRNDLWIADLDSGRPDAPHLNQVQIGVDAQTGVQVGRDGRAYIGTDRDAPRGRLCVADPTDLSYPNWQDLVAEDDIAVLESYAILDGPELPNPVLLVGWTRHAVAEITIHDLVTGTKRGELSLPGLGTIGSLVSRPEGGHEAWFVYTDHITIPRVLRFDARSGEVTVDRYPPGFVEVPNISATMHEYASLDGTIVRLMLLAPLGPNGEAATPTRPRPTVLYGYGGFGVSMAPSFSPSVLAWVEQGGVYAIACLRGGSEEGEAWHRGGMLANKQNVFDDFIAAAEWLIDTGWTTARQLAISGGSNGGLLVGAAMTQRPELFAGVHCSAPLLDMVRYEHFGLGETWNVEYGSASDPEQFEWLYSYSPYHHVTDGTPYPTTLFTVFDHDTRVDPLHARKMCAQLQHASTGTGPIVIRAEADVGHGARSVSRTLGLSADVLGFLAAATGLSIDAGEE